MSDKPLEVHLTDDGVLTISIGVERLAYAFEEHEDNNPYDESVGDFKKLFKVINAQTFARDIRVALLQEEEDGSTPLTVMLDKASWDAVEDGSQGVEEITE